MFLDAYDKLLTLCARSQLTPENKKNIRTVIAQGIDFNKLIEKAIWQRLHALVAYHLSSDDFLDLVSEQTRKQFKQIRLQNMARNMLLQEELARMLKLYNKENIPVIVLKGSALLGTVYQDISLRPMGDMDILVQSDHLILAESIALRQEYKHILNKENPKDHHHLSELIQKKKGVVLEIHHHIISNQKPFTVNIQDFWSRSTDFNILDTPALAFSQEDTIIYLSISILSDLFSHNRAVLGRLCDISEIIREYEYLLDWNCLLKISKENNLNEALYFILYLCDNLLGTVIPPEFWARLKPINFDTDSAISFINRRILNEQQRIIDGLVLSGKVESDSAIIFSLIVRFINAMKRRARKVNDGTFLGGERVKNRKNLWTRLLQVIFTPFEFRKDLDADRWLFGLRNNKSTIR